MAYHEGELEVQARAGVASPRIGVRDAIPPAAAELLAAQRVVIAASTDAAGRIWASLLTGEPGFARAVDWQEIHITPAAGNEVFDGDVGLLAIEFATRRRMRINGRLRHEDKTLVVETREVYSNCPQYITPQAVAIPTLARPSKGALLDDEQLAFIRAADTFFIATAHPETGADASHRGGPAGFVQAEPERLWWADYPGNNMFNTLGNLAVNPHCGLLFTDFARTLQLTGTASIEWDGTERAVAFSVEEVLYTT
ncbi:MAG: pyridoxamine 5'-phosphate oxidase family protein [Acidobacteria bacterium]|nr:pyridoxamine 5'-phosphate oxidase family protein [Acidobacteriota bacterium]